jgi:hypothetical protein
MAHEICDEMVQTKGSVIFKYKKKMIGYSKKRKNRGTEKKGRLGMFRD